MDKEIEDLIEEWLVEFVTSIKHIDLPDIKKLYKLKLWDDIYVSNYLSNLGYSDNDVSTLMLLWEGE